MLTAARSFSSILRRRSSSNTAAPLADYPILVCRGASSSKPRTAFERSSPHSMPGPVRSQRTSPHTRATLSRPPPSLSVDHHTHTERMQRLAFIWQSVKRRRSQLRKPAAKSVVQHVPNLKISIVVHREISAEQMRLLARAGASEGVVVWG